MERREEMFAVVYKCDIAWENTTSTEHHLVQDIPNIKVLLLLCHLTVFI